MNETRLGVMGKAEVLRRMEQGMIQAVEMYLPSIGSEALEYLPLVKKGIRFLITMFRQHSRKDAEKLLDSLLANPMSKL